jgi:hypothetical protein
MGHFSGVHREGDRPGSDYRKRNKERERGRIKVNSPQKFSISERQRRLEDTYRMIFQHADPKAREPLYKVWANMAASSPSEVFSPDKVQGIERYSDLSDNGRLSSLNENYFQGPVSDFLPLHHLVKLLSKSLGHDDGFVYLLDGSSNGISDDIPTRNLRGLEYFLAIFAQRVPSGQYLDVAIQQITTGQRRVQVPHHDEYVYSDKGVVLEVRRQLRVAGISPSDHYTLKRIRDGNAKVGTSLHVISERRHYNIEGDLGNLILSYLATRDTRQ